MNVSTHGQTGIRPRKSDGSRLVAAMADLTWQRRHTECKRRMRGRARPYLLYNRLPSADEDKAGFLMNQRIRAKSFMIRLPVLAAGLAFLVCHLQTGGQRSSVVGVAAAQADSESEAYFLVPRPTKHSEVDRVIERVDPALDSFPTEQYYEELNTVLHELGARLRERPPDLEHVSRLLAPEFKGSRLVPDSEAAVSGSAPVEVFRAQFSALPEANGTGFVEELRSLIEDYEVLRVAEFHVVSITQDGSEGSVVETVVDFELAGKGVQSWRLQKRGHWKLRWIRAGGEWRVSRWTALDQSRSRVETPVFVDASVAAFGAEDSYRKQLVPGIDHWRAALDGAVGVDVFGSNGVSAGDIDGDGWDDMYVSQPSGLVNRLYRNRGDGTFVDVTHAAGVDVLDPTSMSLFFDADNDGDQDLAVITWQAPLLFVNDGRGNFQLKQDAFQFERAPRAAFTSGCLADFDRDGDVDLYICSYIYFLGLSTYRFPTPYHDANNGPPNVLFRNDGTGHFQEVTEALGVDLNNRRFSFACAWGDADQDGWLDLYVANDFGRNNLYRNLGQTSDKPHFRDEAAHTGVEDIGAGMSVTWFDSDNDQRLDLYVGNMWSSAGQRVTSQPAFRTPAKRDTLELYQRHARGNSLFRSRGDGTFSEVLDAGDTAMGRWAWSCDALDFDNDGFQDLYITNGQITNTDTKDL